jgi:hypothetical protein
MSAAWAALRVAGLAAAIEVIAIPGLNELDDTNDERLPSLPWY